MLNLTDGERHYLQETRALGRDADGNEVFVGLTLEESERFHFLSNPHRQSSSEEYDEYLKLHDKHEIARMQVLAVDHLKRTERIH